MASPEISSNKMPAHTTLVFIGSRFLGLGENNAPAGAARRPPEADAGLAGALDPHIWRTLYNGQGYYAEPRAFYQR